MNRGVKMSNKSKETIIDSSSTIVEVGDKKKPAKKKAKNRPPREKTKKVNVLFTLGNKVAIDFDGDGILVKTKKQFKNGDKASLKYTGTYPNSIKIVGID